MCIRDRYEYHLGDKVYIGASEYEILSVDDERVMLYDYDVPLFNKEFSRTCLLYTSYTDAVDDVLCKVLGAKKKKLKIEYI